MSSWCRETPRPSRIRRCVDESARDAHDQACSFGPYGAHCDSRRSVGSRPDLIATPSFCQDHVQSGLSVNQLRVVNCIQLESTFSRSVHQTRVVREHVNVDLLVDTCNRCHFRTRVVSSHTTSFSHRFRLCFQTSLRSSSLGDSVPVPTRKSFTRKDRCLFTCPSTRLTMARTVVLTLGASRRRTIFVKRGPSDVHFLVHLQ